MKTQWCLADRVVKLHRGTRSVNMERVMKQCMKTWTVSHLWHLGTVLLQCCCSMKYGVHISADVWHSPANSHFDHSVLAVFVAFTAYWFVVKSKTASRHFQLVLSFSLLAVSTCANHIKGAVQCGLLMPLDHIKGAVQCGLLMSSTPWPHQRCCSVWPANVQCPLTTSKVLFTTPSPH